jgi:hypothetical protein
MKRTTLAAAALLLATAPGLACAAEQAPPAPSTSAPAMLAFVAPAFAVPTSAEGPGFRLQPLGPDLVKIDFDAYMSSIEHLQQTFTRSTAWPHPGITDAEALLDMQTEAARFAARESFAYAVLTPDGKRERGCIYVSPSPVAGYDAVVKIWVTKAEHDAGFDQQLAVWAHTWIAMKWPFRQVAWPGRDIPWSVWDALPKRT